MCKMSLVWMTISAFISLGTPALGAPGPSAEGDGKLPAFHPPPPPHTNTGADYGPSGYPPEVNISVFMDPAEYSAEFLALQPNTGDGSRETAAVGGRPGGATNTHSCNHIRAVPAHLRQATHMYPRGLGRFYQKYTEAYGIPVLGSPRVRDSTLRRACYVVRFMFADRYAVRNSYYTRYGRFAVMATTEVTTNIPEHASLGWSYNERARGLGATPDRPVSTAGEENVLCQSRDKYRREDIALHEFSHGLHLLGAYFAVPGFEARLRSLYQGARASGRWAHTYAMSTDREYWAEGVQSYFNVNDYRNPANGIHNHVSTRAALAAYDPGLYNLVRQMFPCNNRYLKRCDNDRLAEMNQVLKMNCDGNDGNDGNGKDGKQCGDSDDRCAAWARVGYCGGSSAYVRAHCRQSCGACAPTTTTTAPPVTDPTGCVDGNVHCDYWARTGECSRNPAYMTGHCRRSCRLC